MLSDKYPNATTNFAFALMAVAVAAFLIPAVRAGKTGRGLHPGAWAITWIEPRLTPASQGHPTQFVRCYTKQDAARSANPVMPRAQDSKCKTRKSYIGDDIVYDSDCADADHRLRIFTCGDGFCGVHRYVRTSGPRDSGIFESVVIIRPSTSQCEES